MGFEAKATKTRAADGGKAPSSLEENYRRWLWSLRDLIDLELAGEERAAEWLEQALPRLEEDYRRLHRKRMDEQLAPGIPGWRIIRRGDDDGTPEDESKLRTLKDFVLDSVLRETEARVREEAEAERRREREKERRRRKKHLVATVVALSSYAVFFVSGHLIARRYRFHPMSPSEFVRFMSFETAVLALGFASDVVRERLGPPPPKRPVMKSCPDSDRSRVGLLVLLPS